MFQIDSMNKLAERFASLPGIGPKSAMRLAYHIIDLPADEVKEFSRELYLARLSVRICSVCGNLCEGEVCYICSDDTRDRGTVCVVRDARDVAAFERLKDYRGVYHVLGGTIAPLEGIGPDDIAIAPLLKRVSEGNLDEIILATNPDVQGEATAVYIHRLLSPMGIKVTRIAHGIPVGGELEYTDEITLLRALEGRRGY